MGNGGSSVKRSVWCYAMNRHGWIVDRGECVDLVVQALLEAGAKTNRDFGSTADDVDYVWGAPVNPIAVEPGHILQFRNHTVRIKTVIKRSRRYTDGRKETSPEIEEDETIIQRPHHSAIVMSKKGNGVVEVAEQNQEDEVGKEAVKTTEFRDVPLVGRNVAPKREVYTEPGGITVTQTTTVSVAVSGKVWAYCPVKK
jgi:hypothetical protein